MAKDRIPMNLIQGAEQSRYYCATKDDSYDGGYRAIGGWSADQFMVRSLVGARRIFREYGHAHQIDCIVEVRPHEPGCGSYRYWTIHDVFEKDAVNGYPDAGSW